MRISLGGASALGGNAGGALVLCIGNPLRGDDGVAAAVAAALEERSGTGGGDPLPSSATVLVVHQLTPELSEEIAGASVVIFVDARDGAEPGVVDIARVAGPPDDASAWSHQVDPGSLLALAASLFGRAPSGWTVTVGGSSWEVGAPISPAVLAAVPAAVDAVLRCAAVPRR